MIVAKFGGSSLADGEGFLRVAEIVRRDGIPVVIVSAPGGKVKVTDLLISAYGQWERGARPASLDEACEKFREIARTVGVDLETRLTSLAAALRAGASRDYIVSRGEYLSAFILSELLGYNFVDAVDCVKLTMDGKLDFVSTVAHSGAIKCPCVIPGFYGKLPSGEVKLLPRGGSDISGAAIAAAMEGEYQKWTDVDGIFDGHGGVIGQMSYDEAELLCNFGATVMHYDALPILKNADVRLTVRNTFGSLSGTKVGKVRHEGYALSSAQMFLGEGEAAAHLAAICNEGLRVVASTSVIGRRRILIDGCGFSQSALRRVLRYDGIRRVRATAAIGKLPEKSECGEFFAATEFGSIFVSDEK